MELGTVKLVTSALHITVTHSKVYMNKQIERVLDNELLYVLALSYVCAMAFSVSFIVAYLL